MIKDVVWCINTYLHGRDSQYPNQKYAQCPVCHKIVFVKRDGTLYPHGVTRRKLAKIKTIDLERDSQEDIERAVDEVVGGVDHGLG